MKLIYTTLATFALAVLFLSSSTIQKPNLQPARIEIYDNYPPCLQMYYSIEKYAEMYKIPKNFAYGIAKEETEYRSPFQWSYNQSRTSSAGALGAMQIMPSTAKMMWPDRRITKEKLLNDIDFNVHTSMKILRYLYNIYGDWKIAFGAYNTGRPIINRYAINVYNHR